MAAVRRWECALPVLALMPLVLAEPPSSSPAESSDSAGLDTVLRIAGSDDGLAFTDTGEVFLQNASSPDLIRLPNQDLLAVFDYRDPAAKSDQTILAVSRSKDHGASWSPPCPVRFQGIPDDALQARCGALVAMPSGLVRLYFFASENSRRGAGRRSEGFIASAATRNGLEYLIDREVRIPIEGAAGVQPSAVWIGNRLDLLVSARSDLDQPDRGSGIVRRFSSPDGRRFQPAERMRLAGLAGSIVGLERRHFRLYFSYRNEICSMASVDGTRWGHEPDVRLKNAFDPAVVQLKDGRFLMLYATSADDASRKLPQKALASTTGTTGGNAGSSAEQAVAVVSADGSQVGLAPGEPATGTGGSGGSGASGGSSGPDVWEPFTPSGFESELGDDAALAWGEPDPEGFAPLPDLRNRIDYVRWYEETMLPAADDNAYYSYGSVLGPREDPAWELLSDRYNDSASYGPPGPWSPADWPNWEQSYQTSQDLIAQFRDGSQDPRWFSCPAIYPEDVPESERLMIHVLLPSLANCRAMTKAVLSQAWRAENGIVSPETMRDSLQTVFGNANHLRQDATLIGNLVGIAEASLAEQNARWALERNVFTSADELETALQTLRASDIPDAAPGRTMVAEHAFYMDMVQYMFPPDPATGEPKVNEDRVKYIMGMAASGDDLLQAVQDMTADDVRQAIETGDEHYRRLKQNWEIGYPTVRAQEMSTDETEVAHSNPITRMLLPSLTRAYVLSARQEASRRATQLAYATELFKARNGRYPASLDELPYEYSYDVRTDPFTGYDFGYQIRDGRATIYSLSENATDDGGMHAPRWDDTEGSESDDFVFYPPQE